MPVKSELANAVLEVIQPFPPEHAIERLAAFTARDWRNAYFWLDSHGLTIPLAGRLRDSTPGLPAEVLARFDCNLGDNAKRSRDMLEHFDAVNRRLESAGVLFAVQKGFALCPAYCPDPALRLQLDLDYLVEAEAALQVSSLLEEFGYQRVRCTPREWGFETIPGAVTPHENTYLPPSSRSLELHFPLSDDLPPIHLKLPHDVLQRRRWHVVDGTSFPVLDERDMFLHLVAHALQHFATYSVRLSHLLEIAHFVRGRHADARFWSELRQSAACDPRMGAIIGLVISLAATMFPFPVPPALAGWTVDLLSSSQQEWLVLYARDWCLRETPGSKVSVLALREFIDRRLWPGHVRNVLLPIKRPPKVFYQPKGTQRRGARAAQLRLVAGRAAFHLRELVRFSLAYLRLRGRGPALQTHLPSYH